MPAAKRALIVKGLILYRSRNLKSPEPQLEDIYAALSELAVKERRSQGTASHGGSAQVGSDERIGRIDTREADVIQSVRRSMRACGKAYNTEKAYVKWIRRFMRARGLECQADFAQIDCKNVEDFLTDLAFDGNCAASTQDQAF